MPAYNLCVGISKKTSPLKLFLLNCNSSSLIRWVYVKGKIRLSSDTNKCITIGKGPSKLTRGGRRLPSRHVTRPLALETCLKTLDHRQIWEIVDPIK